MNYGHRRGRWTGAARFGLVLVAALEFALASPLAAQAAESYEKGVIGTRMLEGSGGLTIKMLVERSNLGGSEVELGEIVFPVGAGTSGGGHVHTRVEVFYILEGRLDHVVNGASHLLDPGMVGIVRPGDEVIHRVASEVPVRALVIWAPGGEADRIAGFLEERPIDPR